MLRLGKEQVTELISNKAPEYIELFREFQSSNGGWLVWPKRFLELKTNLKLDNYVLLYQNERAIEKCFGMFLMGKDGHIEWEKSLNALSIDEQQQYIDDLAAQGTELKDADIDELLGKWPETEEEKTLAKAELETMSEVERNEAIYRVSCLGLHLFANIHNYFALMVSGEKLTSLVPKAMQGDDDAFCRAVKIDRNLSYHHPYFIEREKRAQENAEVDFLKKLSSIKHTPGLIGKIQYPGLYVVFAMLEHLNWLNDLTHAEILDICDEARLDRWENRIEDESYLGKRLSNYRKFQKTGGVSTH